MLRSSPNNEALLSLEKTALQDLETFSKSEESLARQKSRALWIKEGDQNSSYFHHYMRDRVNINKIISLTLEDGSKIFQPQEIHQASIHYFQNFFMDPLSSLQTSDVRSFVNKSILAERAVDLERFVS